MHISESSASAVFASENWLTKVRFQVLEKRAGKNYFTAQLKIIPKISEGGKNYANY